MCHAARACESPRLVHLPCRLQLAAAVDAAAGPTEETQTHTHYNQHQSIIEHLGLD